MTVRGSPVVPPLLTAAAIVIVVFGLKYSSDVMAPIFLAATLAILFTPALWWLEKKGLPPWLALVVMVLALGGLIVLMIFILTTSLEQLSLKLPEYAALLHQRIDNLAIAALGLAAILGLRLFFGGEQEVKLRSWSHQCPPSTIAQE